MYNYKRILEGRFRANNLKGPALARKLATEACSRAKSTSPTRPRAYCRSTREAVVKTVGFEEEVYGKISNV